MHRVFCAAYPGSQELGSMGNATYMLIRQIDFPDTYLEQERLTGSDHDRTQEYFGLGRSHEIFQRHTGGGELSLRAWVRSATKDELIAFIAEHLKADKRIRWTGCRVLGTTNRSNGHTVWTLELFRKHRNSSTLVYSTANAPNVAVPPRVVRRDGSSFYHGAA